MPVKKMVMNENDTPYNRHKDKQERAKWKRGRLPEK